MKFFTYNETIDEQLKMILRRVRKLMNGEVAAQLQSAGLKYNKLFGVSLVHLRQLSQEYQPDNELAERLWHREIRETMILATMIADRENLSKDKLMEWGSGISNLELAEQLAFNLLGKRSGSAGIIEQWMLHPQFYVRYAALMSLGWQFRFVGNELAPLVRGSLGVLEALASDGNLSKAVVHSLKMAGRFSEELRPEVRALAQKWNKSDQKHLQAAGDEISLELEMGGR